MTDHELRSARASATGRTAVVGAAANLAMSIGKISVGYLANSHALIADGVHSFSDLLTDILVWVAGRHASQAPDEDHPYGHARYETIATLLLGAFLVTVAVSIGWNSAGRLFTPDQLLQPGVLAIYAAAASIIVNEWLFWYTLSYARRVRSDMLRANAWHHRSDAISSVVVLVGVAGTMAGLHYLDAIAAIAVAIMIARIGGSLAWEAMQELVDTGLGPDRVSDIQKTIQDIGGVRDIHMLRTRKLGGQASIDVHVLVDPKVSVSEGHLISALVEHRLIRDIKEISDVTVHIDTEDDETEEKTNKLPLRTEALARLDRLWADIDEASRSTHTVLHYLNGQIDVEVFFPVEMIIDRGETRNLAARLQQAAGQDTVFGKVTAYFG